MQKKFSQWSIQKANLHSESTVAYYHEREIWWCALGVNIGFEQDGTGENFDIPVVILRGFNTHTFFAVALTGRKKAGAFYFYLGKVDDRDATAILSQVRILDTKRLIKKIGTLHISTFQDLKNACKDILFP